MEPYKKVLFSTKKSVLLLLQAEEPFSGTRTIFHMNTAQVIMSR